MVRVHPLRDDREIFGLILACIDTSIHICIYRYIYIYSYLQTHTDAEYSSIGAT